MHIGRVSTLHRTLGKVYAIGVLIGTVGGIYMALTIPPGYRPYATGLIGLDVACIVHRTQLDQRLRQQQRLHSIQSRCCSMLRR